MDELLQLVDLKWHVAFREFIRSGTASEEFLAYLESDENCQEAVDRAIDQLAEIFEGAEVPVGSSA
jgi:hypothetical protein